MSAPSPSAEVLCQQARDRLKKRDVPGAVSLYEQAVALDDRHIPAKEGLATACFLARDYEGAIAQFKRVSQMDPRKVDPLVNLGAIYNRRGEFRDAVRILRQALGKDRHCAEAYYNLGIAEKGLNQLKMSVSAYREAIRLAPGMAEAHYNLGNVLLQMGNSKQAAQSFERALEIRPDFEKARHGLEKARGRIDDARSAASPFGRLVDMDEVERRQEGGGPKLRDLGPQERFEDRTEVHRLAKQAENSAGEVLAQLQSELSPVLLEMVRVMTEKEDRQVLAAEEERFREAVGNYEQISAALFRKLDELKAHEEQVR